MIGLLLGEQLSYAKLAGIVLVVIGGIVLVAYKVVAVLYPPMCREIGNAAAEQMTRQTDESAS